MAVPTSGSFKMFDTGSGDNQKTDSIRGAMLYSSGDNVGGSNGRKLRGNMRGRAKLHKFHPSFFQGLTLNDVTRATHFRGYPISDEEYTCFGCNFELITFNEAFLTCITFEIYTGSLPAEEFSSDNGLRFYTDPLAFTKTSCANSGSTTYCTVYTSSNVTFLGWSYDLENIESTSPSFGHPVGDDPEIIYAMLGLGNTVSKQFCYYGENVGQTSRCNSCADVRTIYFDSASYYNPSNTLTDLIWYSNNTTSSYADNGYYIPIYTPTGVSGQQGGINYLTTGSNGIVHSVGNCSGADIYCT
jgi:hypothetical protein